MSTHLHRHVHAATATTIWLAAISVAAAQSIPVTDPAALAFSGPSAARIESIWHLRSNPASLWSRDTPSVAASFSPSTSGIPGYLEGSLVARTAIDSTWRAGAVVDAAGIEGYREIGAAIVGGIRAGSLSFGATLRCHALAIERYGSALGGSLDIGIIASLNDEIRFGGSIANLARSRSPIDMPQRIGFGCAFDLDRATTLSFDVHHQIGHPVSTSLALSYRPIRQLMLRFGAATFPLSISTGLGYDAGAFLFDYGGAWMEVPGVRHAVGLGVRL